MVRMSNLKPQIDLSLFNNLDINCNGMCSLNDNFEDLCVSLKRIISAQNYYQALDTNNNQFDQNVFLKFVNQDYCHILNDYQHLLHIYNNNIWEINQILIKQQQCDVSKCKYSFRHYSRDQIKKEENKIYILAKLI